MGLSDQQPGLVGEFQARVTSPQKTGWTFPQEGHWRFIFDFTHTYVHTHVHIHTMHKLFNKVVQQL